MHFIKMYTELTGILCLSFSVESEEPGLNEKDMEASIATLEAIATSLNAQCVLLRERTEVEGKVKEFLVRKEADQEDFMEVR